MAVKIGNSYVTEAAYAYATQKTKQSSTDQAMLAKLSNEFRDVNFSTNTAPYQGTGTNNIAIAPNILRDMASNPQKRLEYEALIYDCNAVQKSMMGKTTITGSKIAAQGFIIDANGGLSSWCVTQADDTSSKSSIALQKKDSKNWMEAILGGKANWGINQYV